MKIVIPGKPIAKKRPRFARIGKFVRTYNEQETEESRFLWEVKQHMNGEKPLDGPLAVQFVFFLPRPKGHYGTGKNAGKLKPSAPKYHIKKPDCDNLEKFVADCLNGLVWKDDSQIIKSITEKHYSEQPRTEIIIEVVR
jgi:Holliday junction resolvase RusA-like endonuclease